MPLPSDRRRAPRFPANLECTCVPVGNEMVDKPWPARIEDISCGGINLAVRRRFERGTRLIVELHDPAKSTGRTLIVCVAHVRANGADGWQLGCSIDGELDAATTDLLRLKTAPPPERLWQRTSSPMRTTCYVGGSENGALRQVRVENVSRGGIGLEVAQPVPEGAYIEVQVPHAKSPLHRVLARVIRVTEQKDDRWFLGCAFFAELSDRELAAFVNGNPPDDFKLEQGYTLLFNGKDLTDWEQGYPPQEGRAIEEKLHGKTVSKHRVFEVVDGLLIVTGKALRAVYTAREYNEPFHLKLECRTAADTEKSAGSLILRGAEFRLHATKGDGSTNGVTTVAHLKEGAWNQIDVSVMPAVVSNTLNGQALTKQDVLGLIVQNGQPTATLNGQPIKLATLEHAASAQAICRCNGQTLGQPLTIPASGVLGLQSQIGKFEFRRIRIKEMP